MSSAYVLLAEPDRANAARLSRTLTTLTSLPCHVASDGNEGHALLAAHGVPALLVTELSLPKRDGFALIRGLRRTDARRVTRVIGLSSFPAIRTAAQDLAGELGPLVVLEKPTDAAIFERAVLPPARAPAPRTSQGLPSLPPLPPPRRAAADAEPARLRRIEELGILDDSPADAELQRIVADVAASFGVPTALVSVVLENRQWIKSHVGLTGDLLAERGSPRDISFCHHVVEGRASLIVPDARTHPLFSKNPLVISGDVGSYAGAPIVTPTGEVLGSLCIIDKKPLSVGAPDIAELELIARRVAGELQLGAARRRREPPVSAGGPAERAVVLRSLAAALDVVPCAMLMVDDARRVIATNGPFEALFDVKREDVVGVRRDTVLSRLSRAFADPEEALRQLLAPPEGPFVICAELKLAGEPARTLRWSTSPVDVPGGHVQITTLVVRE